MANHISSICSALRENGDDGSLGAALADWMARPCEPEETKWLSDNGRMMDWSGVLARRADIVKHELGGAAR